MAVQTSLVLEQSPPRARRTGWMVPLAAGIFLGALVFDALPAALATIGAGTWVWAAAGFGLMTLSSRAAGASGMGRMTWFAAAGVWFHSILEGVAAGTGGAFALGGGMLLVMGLIVHLIPESAALFALGTEAGLSAKRAFVRCALTWGMVVTGFTGARLFAGEVPPATLATAMALAAGIFAYLAWAMWQRRSRDTGHQWVGAVCGLLWVALIHLA